MVDLTGPMLCPAVVAAIAVLVVVGLEDFASFRIGDDRIAAIAALALTARASAGGPGELFSGAVSGSLVLSGALAAVAAHARWRGTVGMGGGDVKLLAALTVLFGASALGPILLTAAVMAIPSVVWRLTRGGCARSSGIAFAPYLVIAAVALQIAVWVAGRPWQYVVAA
jgi:prepilin signal peptidase PulO-like enzyme (type II secretory pathway)